MMPRQLPRRTTPPLFTPEIDSAFDTITGVVFAVLFVWGAWRVIGGMW